MKPSNAKGAVEIWFPVERDSIGYPGSQEWEQLWSRPTDCGYQIDNIPFFTKGVAYGDIVAASQTDQGWFILTGSSSLAETAPSESGLIDEYVEEQKKS